MFGSAVAINKKGTVMAVGAKSDDTQSSGGGAVYIFDRLTSAQTWTQRAKMYHFKSSEIVVAMTFLEKHADT